jgi:hypothetical protein
LGFVIRKVSPHDLIFTSRAHPVILCLLEMKFLMKMVLGKFREHPVLGGNEVFSEIGTGKRKFRERPVFLAN